MQVKSPMSTCLNVAFSLTHISYCSYIYHKCQHFILATSRGFYHYNESPHQECSAPNSHFYVAVFPLAHCSYVLVSLLIPPYRPTMIFTLTVLPKKHNLNKHGGIVTFVHSQTTHEYYMTNVTSSIY